jgi:cytochrome P450
MNSDSTGDCLLSAIDFAHDEVPHLHDLIDGIRDFGPLVPIRYWGQRRWLIHRYFELRQAFLDEEHFASKDSYQLIAEPSMGKTIQTMGGEEHRRNRLLVSAPFTPRAVRELVESLLEPIAHELLDGIDGATEVDLLQAFTQPYPFRVITRVLALPVDDEPKFLHWAGKLIDYPWDPEGALKARQDFTDYLAGVLGARRKTPGSDLISQLAHTEIEREVLTDEEIFSFCRMLFPAGSDTTYKMLGSLLFAVLRDPTIRAKAGESDQARRDIVQEGLRWEPPVALLPRVCSREIELGGVSLEKGDPVLFGMAPANRDPLIFDTPGRFDPGRKNNGMALTFGMGEHFCLGRNLARAELMAALKVIVDRFPEMTLIPEKPTEIIYGSIRGPRDLWVRPHG